MRDKILDEYLVPSSQCYRSFCPTDEEIKNYHTNDEDIYNEIEERIYRCSRCKEREAELDGKSEFV